MMSAVTGHPAQLGGRRRGWFLGLSTGFKNLIVGTLLCATPVTAIIVLGWLVRYMGTIIDRRLGRNSAVGADADRARWLLGPRRHGLATRMFGALFDNIRTGLAVFLALTLATLPFTGLWTGAWWAGWENSFNKGYEQSWIGPTFGLTGTAIGLLIMAHLPMALAHIAGERRAAAIFEVRRIRSLVACAGFRYILLSAATVFFALPLFAMRGLPVFGEQIFPGLATLSPDELELVVGLIGLAKAGYVFVMLVILRGLSARLYAFAVLRSPLFGGLAASTGPAGVIKRKQPWLFFRAIQMLLLLVVWFGLVAQIFLGQFLNQNWWLWLNHPFLLLPWMP
jgi:hypothetical protein